MISEQIALLKGELEDKKYEHKTPREIARMLSARPDIANPSSAQKVPAPFTADDLKLTVDTLADDVKVELVNIIAEQDHAKLRDYGTLGGKNLTLIASKLIDDPTHPATVPGDSPLMALGIRVLEWGGMTFTDSIPRGAVEDVQNG